MASYTMELRRVCQALIGLNKPEDYYQIDSVISQAIPLIFDFDFPIFDENYRKVIEHKILKTYYFREICDIPVSKWKMFLNIKLNNIMPYYNQLYESEKLSFNPLYTSDYTREYTRTENKDQTEKINATSILNVNETNTNNRTDKLAHSDTPQGSLLKLETLTYLSQADINQYETTDTGKATNTNSSDTDRSDNATTTEGYLETIKGKNGGESYAKLLMEFRTSIINIDMMLLDELESLFFPIY